MRKFPTDLDLYEEYREKDELPSAAEDAATAMMESATPEEEEIDWDGVWKEPETILILSVVVLFLILTFGW
tara:strand:+ start:4309 stop:4521 length:213 start_codon:yes stop_codon:yes gene_type:complete